MCKFPEIPVGGRLRFFVKEWEKITEDQWVLSVLREGLKMDFIQKPPFMGVKETHVTAQNLNILQLEVDKLLQKGAIENVPPESRQTGFYSTFFLVPKKTGDLRPIINLRPLNRYLRKEHFKMDCLSKVMSLVQQGDWAIFSRFVRRLPSHSSPQKIQTIPKVLHSGESLPIHLPLFWSHNGAKGLHQNSVRDCSISKDAECAIGSLSRRLVSGKSVKEITFTGQRKSAQSSCQTRSHDKSRKISSNSMSESNIHRGSFPVRQGTCLPYSRENSEN